MSPVLEAQRSIAATLWALRELRHGRRRRTPRRWPRPSNMGRFETAVRQSGGRFAGSAVALKQADGVRTAQVAVRLYVARKRSRRRLRSLGTFPSRAEFGASSPAIAIDVVELTEAPELHLGCAAGAGIAAGRAKGTLAGVVADSRGMRFGLTCAHVVAPWSTPNPFGTPVKFALPGREDTEALGTVEDWTRFSALDANTADAALVRLAPDVLVDNALGSAAAIDTRPIAELDLLHGESVRIRTRRGDVAGLVDSVENDLDFSFAGRSFPFSNVIAYRAGVMPGDSGSSVVLGADRVLGLHFAGTGISGPGYCVTGRKILQAFANRQLRLI